MPQTKEVKKLSNATVQSHFQAQLAALTSVATTLQPKQSASIAGQVQILIQLLSKCMFTAVYNDTVLVTMM